MSNGADCCIPMPNGKDDQNKKGWKFYTFFVGSIVFSCIIFGLLIASLKVDGLQNCKIWDFELWKWCVLLLVVLCGGLTVYLFLLALESLIIEKFLSEVGVVYYFHGLKRSVLVFIWLALVFLAWVLLFDRGDNKQNEDKKKTVNGATRGIGGCLIGAALWLLKTLSVKLAASFHMKNLFEKIKAADRSRKIFESISTKPQDGTMKYTTTELFDAIRNKKLPNLCYEKKEITDENTAANTANEIFKKFERGDDERYMDMDDLLKHIPADVDDYKHFKAVAEKKQKDEGEQIKRSVFRSWVVSLYNSYDSVNSALKQRKTAVDELNKLASVIALVIIIIVWLLFMEYLSTKVLVFISSQFLLVVFMFGNTTKTIFEAIVFVFIMHPFDVGDRCVIDGIQASP
ncbi:mechanosensitive ion channel protein 4-like [Hevea brasiliensis]|uniref:mechanosensitive ion channel protein 4-like n=1 Tax=Hevea brasiliensis TaxID=3981 RepID=UPI0025FCB644|nr:mechanosensitive ion channel protein 4-like [Hevea brasiliensis]